MKPLLILSLLGIAVLPTQAAVTIPTAIAGYKFDEISGTTATDSIRGATGNATLVVTSASQTSDNANKWITQGKIGGAIDLDGLNDYLYALDPVISNLSQMTISLWVNVDANSNWASFVKNWGGGGAFHFGLDSNTGKISNYLNDSGGINVISTSVFATGTGLGNWHQVALTYNGTVGQQQHKLYVDGALYASAVTGGIPANLVNGANTIMSIGAKGNASSADSFLNGKIDDLVFYDQALDATQIDQIFDNGNANISAVPEPSAALLGGLGLLALLRRRRA